jgi:energy-coupling factor transporter ATP-binding protein EcfA2
MTARTNPILHLVNTLQSERDILIFLGAGSSTEGSQDDAPFPDFEMLVSRILQDEGVLITESRMNDFLEIMRRWERESTLSVRLASYLYGSPGISHLQLASMTMSLFPAINMAMYLTTNFDDLMFKALSAVSKNAPQRDPRTFSLKKSAVINEITQIFQAIPRHTQQGAPVVVKLFGDLASNSPIFDPQEMPFDEFTEGKLIKLLDRTTLFIGYGLHDAPILRLLIRSGSQRPVFVVAPVNPIDDRIVQISQRVFYWLPKTFSEFISELIEAVSAKNPIFEKTFANFLKDASSGLVINSRWALRECAQNASAPARARHLNRTRGGEIGKERASIRAVARPDTGPDFEAFKVSEKRILGIVGESGSGKSTLLFQMYENNSTSSGDQYIYYDAQSFQSAGSISAKLALDLAVDTAKLVPLLQQIGSTLNRKGAQLFVFIDALNESVAVDPLIIRYEIENLTRELPDNIRFVFSCRRVFWDAYMNPSNDLPLEDYSDGKTFLLSKFSAAEAKSAYEHYRNIFQLKSEYGSLSGSLREHIRDPLMLRFISETYRASLLPQFAPAVLVFREVMNSLRLHYRQTPLIDFLDCLIDQRLDQLLQRGDANDIFFYRAVRTDSNLALLAQQQMAGRLHAEHPLTILEDENIIAPMESVATRFKFAYERFYEYLIGLRLHYKIFSGEGTRFLDFLTANLDRFRDAHYSFYQGLKSAFVMEYISTADVERRREIALLAREYNQTFAAFGRDVLREVAFETGKDAVSALAFVDDGQASTAALVLDLGFETEGVLPYAIQGLFEDDVGVRRRSVSCLIFHARNFGSLEKMNCMVVDVVKNGPFHKDTLSRGLTYFFAAVFGVATDKSAALHGMRCLLANTIAKWPTKLDLAGIAFALDDVIKIEGPLFFGANYGPNGIFYPWQDLRSDVVRYNTAVRAILHDPSASALRRNFDALLFLSKIRVELARDSGNANLFAYQIEYRIVQWVMVKAWMQDDVAVLELLDLIVEHGEAFNIDFALGIVEHALFRMPPTDRDFLVKCRAKMLTWIERFEERFAEFYLSLNEADPFAFNLVPLAVLARVEAQFFTAESGVVPCISAWLSDPSPARRKMALLAANWLSQEFPAKVLTTLEPSILQNGLVDWYDRVLAGFEWHSPRLLEEFFNKMHLPTRRRTKIRNLNVARGTGEVQYQSESFFSWLFLGDQTRLDELSGIYTMIYTSPSSRDFFLRLLRLWVEGTRVSVE